MARRRLSMRKVKQVLRNITNLTLPLLIATVSFAIFTSNGQRSCRR